MKRKTIIGALVAGALALSTGAGAAVATKVEKPSPAAYALETTWPSYELTPFHRTVDGVKQYVDTEWADRYFADHHRDDLAVVAKHCGLGAYSEFTQDDYYSCALPESLENDDQAFYRVFAHIALVQDLDHNSDLADAVDDFNDGPSDENLARVASLAGATDHNVEFQDDYAYYDYTGDASRLRGQAANGASDRSWKPTGPRPAGGNIKAAIAYARKYYKNYNTQYNGLNHMGGDCANFVSQIMHAGGKPLTRNWQPYTTDWKNSNAMFRNVINPASRWEYDGFAGAARQASPGNVIFLDNDGNGVYEHTGFVVGKRGGELEIAQHNRDYLGWTSGVAKNWKKTKRMAVGAW